MSAKRYAIVKIDNCPSKFEKGFDDYFVCDGKNKDMRLNADKINCNNCRYGDTKEHLIKKVAQIRFKQETQYGSKDMLKAVYNMCYRQAKEIVEFLGVE